MLASSVMYGKRGRNQTLDEEPSLSWGKKG